jgi:DNA-binding IclR family transcriptional regulator
MMQLKFVMSLGYVCQKRDSKRYRIDRPLFELAASDQEGESRSSNPQAPRG